jgi:cyclopropane fatty-acyl-phospholipid synthase-like methyltransferase
MSLRFHEIAEANHRILNPFTDEKLMLLGEICRLEAGQRQLDLACGKGEMLCRWAQRFRTEGVGIDLSEVFLAAARARAAELGVADRVRFVLGDAGTPPYDGAPYDVVSCIGATWIGGGLAGTIEMMRPALREGGLLLIGEPYWISEPPSEALAAPEIKLEAFTSLLGTADRLADAGVDLVEMVLAHQDSWDRYVAAQWWTLDAWLRAHPNDPDVAHVRQFLDGARRWHLAYGRQYLGWGVFVGRPTSLRTRWGE